MTGAVCEYCGTVYELEKDEEILYSDNDIMDRVTSPKMPTKIIRW